MRAAYGFAAAGPTPGPAPSAVDGRRPLGWRAMRAVTFQAPGEVLVEDVPEPEIERPDDAIVQIEASGMCGSDLHIYHGRVPVEPGFTIGHEFVGTVLAAGPDVRAGAPSATACSGCFQTACGTCFACVRGDYHRCDATAARSATARKLGDLPGAQAERLLVPRADLMLRKVPEGMSDEVALFAGDVMGTGYHAVAHAGLRAGDIAAVLGLGPGRAVRRAGRPGRGRRPGVRDRHRPRAPGDGRAFGATPVHLTEEDPKRASAPRPRGAAWTSSSTPSAIPRRWSSRSASRATPGSSPAIGVYAERARCRSGCVDQGR